ncbi:unnamed protein product [Rodentolepis nana]|uniref:Endo/exonuclease/phosphatase domain-containing protein n=1 Tax=Rodentolepis nana TaxID=102285 RepID=A0A0R3TS48_RODNA|nr:unnamed protein product [Rodentolepis nana]
MLKECHLQILQWNAGGMSPDQKIQIQKILQTYDVAIFTIMEANISDAKTEVLPIPRLHPVPVAIFTIMEANISDATLKYYQFPGIVGLM